MYATLYEIAIEATATLQLKQMIIIPMLNQDCERNHSRILMIFPGELYNESVSMILCFREQG